MSSQETLNGDQLLQPIAGDSPTGTDLRAQAADSYDSVYWQIRSARYDSGEIERRHAADPADPSFDLSKCSWSEIISKSTEVLANKSKDLEVVAWLSDALVRVHGFAGLRDGLRLARGMVERYWDGLFPSLDPGGDGVKARVSQFGGLFQARRHPALYVPLTAGEKLSELDYEQALALDKVADPKEKQARIAKGEVTMQKFTDAVRETPTPVLKTLVEDIEECLLEGEKFVAVLKPKCGKNERGEDVVPSARELSDVLKQVLAVVKRVAGDRLATPPAATPATNGDGSKASSGNAAEVARPKEPTRDTAIAQLRELADFFRRTEPHSPISHHLEEAVRWGQMALPDLLNELVPDEKARKDLFTRIGIAISVKK